MKGIFQSIIEETVQYWKLNRFGTPVIGATARVMSHYHHQWYLGGREVAGKVGEGLRRGGGSPTRFATSHHKQASLAADSAKNNGNEQQQSVL